jgi:hypothetical protein
VGLRAVVSGFGQLGQMPRLGLTVRARLGGQFFDL